MEPAEARASNGPSAVTPASEEDELVRRAQLGSAEFGAGITLLVRARAEGATSNVVKVQQRPSVILQKRPGGTFFVFVNAARSFWRKRIVLQRFDNQRRSWADLKKAVLTETGSRAGSPFQWSKTGPFQQKVPRETTVRATLPLSQARPCYLAGYSNLLRTCGASRFARWLSAAR